MKRYFSSHNYSWRRGTLEVAGSNPAGAPLFFNIFVSFSWICYLCVLPEAGGER